MARSRIYLFTMCAMLMGAVFAPSLSLAQSVSVEPKRIVFTGRDRTKEVYLLNSGDEEETYRVFFQEMRMKPGGGVEKVEEGEPLPEGYKPSSSMLRYSPRQVVIPAHGSQVVRFMLRKPSDLADGEYRSHVLFQAVPKDRGTSLEDTVLKEGEISVQIIPVFGVSIPMIVRHGDLSADAGLSNLRVESDKDGGQSLLFQLNRTGNRSLYGHFQAFYKPPGGGDEVLIGAIKGVAVYDTVSSRSVSVYLRPPEGTTLQKGGTITLKFEEDRDMGGNATAEASITL